jgi:hypothetical protein
MDQVASMLDGISPEELDELTGERGLQAFEEMQRQYREMLVGVPFQVFMTAFNMGYLSGFHDAEETYSVHIAKLMKAFGMAESVS